MPMRLIGFLDLSHYGTDWNAVACKRQNRQRQIKLVTKRLSGCLEALVKAETQ